MTPPSNDALQNARDPQVQAAALARLSRLRGEPCEPCTSERPPQDELLSVIPRLRAIEGKPPLRKVVREAG